MIDPVALNGINRRVFIKFASIASAVIVAPWTASAIYKHEGTGNPKSGPKSDAPKRADRTKKDYHPRREGGSLQKDNHGPRLHVKPDPSAKQRLKNATGQKAPQPVHTKDGALGKRSQPTIGPPSNPLKGQPVIVLVDPAILSKPGSQPGVPKGLYDIDARFKAQGNLDLISFVNEMWESPSEKTVRTALPKVIGGLTGLAVGETILLGAGLMGVAVTAPYVVAGAAIIGAAAAVVAERESTPAAEIGAKRFAENIEKAKADFYRSMDTPRMLIFESGRLHLRNAYDRLRR